MDTPTASPDRSDPRTCSPFLAELDRRNPDWLDALKREGRLQANHPPDSETLTATIERHGLDAGLRRFRNREMLRITWRELAGTASQEETLADLSTLAELCLEAALSQHHAALEARFGTPRGPDGEPQAMVVLGLGKLGGSELNLSSDIDLILCFPAAGTCDGPRGLSNEQFFTRLARAMIASLAERTEDGFCFRVDTRLRPYGEAGPLVCSFNALELYYQREGRDWERYALVKARPVAGDRQAGAALMSTLSPFVYRRYIDFGAVESLRTMLDAIREDAARRDRGNDVKRGPGGIREVEFLVQCMQLLRGGRLRELRTPSLAKALEAIGQLDLLPLDRINRLYDSYRFLRRLENAIQAQHDQQTHSLPAGDDLQRITVIMDQPGTAALEAALEATRADVTAALDKSFPRQDEPAEPQLRWRSRDELLQPGFIAQLDRRTPGPRSQKRLDQFMPLLLASLERRQLEQAVRDDVLALVLAISRRSAYLALLIQNPAALERLLDLFDASDWVADTVVRYPSLLDELLDPALGRELPAREALTQSARRITGRGDDEDRLHGLNELKMAQCFRIAVAELDETISATDAEQHLTTLAEVILQTCLDLSSDMLSRRYPAPPGDGLAVIGYGSLGAGDISYNSDLDLVFLYPDQTDQGAGTLAPETWFTRQVRRLLALATTTTAAGRLYEIDTRLRPNGRSGLLVSPMHAFSRYQEEKAWTWERQALTRARLVAGNTSLRAPFRDTREAVLAASQDVAGLRTDVATMRQRMRDQLGAGDPIKHGIGGLLDIDFLAQLGVLEMAPQIPALRHATDTREQLDLLGQSGWLDAETAAMLIETHRALTRARHLQALCRNGCGTTVDREPAAAVCARFGIAVAPGAPLSR